MKGDVRDAFSPESLTILRTPAFLPASTNADCVRTIWSSEEEITRTRSTPESALVRVSGRVMSPSTSSTPGKLAKARALGRSRTSARTGTCSRANSRMTAEPAWPFAPVTRIISDNLLLLTLPRSLVVHFGETLFDRRALHHYFAVTPRATPRLDRRGSPCGPVDNTQEGRLPITPLSLPLC